MMTAGCTGAGVSGQESASRMPPAPESSSGAAPEARQASGPRAAPAAGPATGSASGPATAAAPEPAARAPSPPHTCARVPFAVGIPLAEASGATYVPAAQAPYLVVAADSGRKGQIVELDPGSGEVLRAGHLPLDRDASDDLEGLTLVGDTFYGITSSGWMRHWRRRLPARGKAGAPAEARYELSKSSYPVGPAAPSGDVPPLVCKSPRDTNCARNYEGLCLRNPAVPDAHCAGFAASKTDGALYCLVFRGDGTLAIDPSRTIAVTRSEALTGCHFAPDEDLLWVGTNLLGGNRVYAVTGWDDPEKVRIESMGVMGTGFGEAIAVGPERAIYRFSDTATVRSLVDKYICE